MIRRLSLRVFWFGAEARPLEAELLAGGGSETQRTWCPVSLMAERVGVASVSHE